jgi:hypothetical protein
MEAPTMKPLTLREAISTARVQEAPEPTVEEPAARPIPAPGIMSRSLVWGLVVASAAATVWSMTGAARDCRFKPITLALGLDRQISATVPRGVPCSVRTLTGDATVEDLAVHSPPRHGELAPRGRTGVFYRPDPKFKGEDSFAFALRGGPNSSHAQSIIRVQMTVK